MRLSSLDHTLLAFDEQQGVTLASPLATDITGAGTYASDWTLPGQLYGHFVRADRAHAKIVSIDASAARKVPVVSYDRLTVREYPNVDEPVVSVSTTYPGASASIIETQVTQILEGGEFGDKLRKLKAETDHLQYPGFPDAAVRLIHAWDSIQCPECRAEFTFAERWWGVQTGE